MQAFRPFEAHPSGTVQIAATSTTGNVAIPGDDASCRVVNAGTADAYVEFGATGVTATVPNGATAGSMRIKAGTVEVFTMRQPFTFGAAITAGTDTTTVEFTRGAGI